MIYTITMGPALNCVQKVESFKKGGFNRGYDSSLESGGKGINISIILKRLNVESVALGFLGGFVGEYIFNDLKAEGVMTNFVRVTGNSRINFKILADEDKSETQVNGSGPLVTPDVFEELLEKLEDIKGDDIVIVDGLVPPGISQQQFENVLDILEKKKAKIIIEASDKYFLGCLKYKPFLMKPNNYELSEIFQKPMDSEESVIEALNYLHDNGAQNIIVYRGKDGIIFMDEKKKIYRRRPIEGNPISKFGSGDALVAGFICGYQLYDDYDKAIDLAVACGTARAMVGHHPNKNEVLYYLDILNRRGN